MTEQWKLSIYLGVNGPGDVVLALVLSGEDGEGVGRQDRVPHLQYSTVQYSIVQYSISFLKWEY